MNNSERLGIDTSASHTYFQRSRTERRSHLPQSNILLGWADSPHGEFLATENQMMRETLQSLTQYGFAPISEAYVLHAYVQLMERDGLTLPYADQFKRNDELRENGQLRRQIARERTEFLEGIKKRIAFTVAEGVVHIHEKRVDTTVDITDAVVQSAPDYQKQVEDLASFDSVSGHVVTFLKDFSQQNQGLAILVGTNKIDTISPLIGIAGSGTVTSYLQRNADKIHTGTGSPVPTILRETVASSAIVLQREKLKKMVEDGEIDVLPTFTRENWPRYGLMDHVKAQVQQAVKQEVAASGIVCDELDAQYQVLFRLTSLGITRVFENGERLDAYCQEQGAYADWQNLQKLDESVFRQYQLREDVMRDVMSEQMHLIQTRLSRSKLPIGDIVTPSGIFAEEGWEIKKRDGQVMAIKRDENGTVSHTQAISFRPVENELATQYHQDLHYIHTPRAASSFGLFLEGEELPFSILAVEPVDRAYKQNTLLLFGYDPRYCLDFTRLYSRPGTPHNTSSAMFGEAFAYIKRNTPKIEAAISAFMPSYATGMSMLTGGFEVPVLMKPNVHYFRETEVAGRKVVEQVTKRRQFAGETVTQSQFPLLPVIELISPITHPKFEPILTVGKDIVQIP